MAARFHGLITGTANTTAVELELPTAAHPAAEVYLRVRETTGDLTLLATEDDEDGVLLRTSEGDQALGWVRLSSCPRWILAGAEVDFTIEVYVEE